MKKQGTDDYLLTDKMFFLTVRFQVVRICDILVDGLDDVFTDVNSIHKTYLLK